MKHPAVFELIKSMNMSEKRQFKIYSSRHVIEGENKYTVLFDILEKMENYDANELTASLKSTGKDTIYIKADMNYLYQLILKSLVLFHSGKSAQIILNESISAIEILYYKSLFTQCRKEIYKAGLIARNTELFSSLLKILQYEKLVYHYLPALKRTELEIIREMAEVSIKLQVIIEYYNLYNQANQIRIEAAKTRNIREIKSFDKLMKHPILDKEYKAPSLDGKIKYYQIYAMWCYVHGNKKEELQYNKKIISLFESNPFYKEEHLVEYINTYARIISISKDMPEKIFYKELENVRKVTILTEKLYYHRISAQIFNFSYSIELSNYLQKKQFTIASTIIMEIENGLKRYKDILTPSYKSTFLYMLAYYYFTTGNFDIAMKKINALLNDYTEDERPDLYNFAKLLNLLIHFELKNYSYIHYKRASVQYYFKKQSSSYETENLILKFFSKEKNYTLDLEKSLRNLKSALENTKSHSLEKYAFNYFDWIDWINSKLGKKSSISMLYK
jgi:hypothetical protein